MEILREIPVLEFNLVLAIIVLSTCAVIGFVIGFIIEYISGSYGTCILCLLLGLVVGLIMGGVLGDHFSEETGEFNYEIQVDENIKLLDFFDKYEIVEKVSRNTYIVSECNEETDNDNKSSNTKQNNEVNIKKEGD